MKKKKPFAEVGGHYFKEDAVIEDLKEKEIKFKGLDNQISRSGFIEFNSYLEKLKMMSTPLFLFGMKLFRQQGFVEFFDADFCNTILVTSKAFTDKTLG